MASSERKPPLKGILKKPTSTTAPTPPPSTTTKPRDPRAIALHHANLLQSRKATEAAIFDSTLHLLDLPHHAQHVASAPHPADVAAFTHHVRLFQPSDYDDLITERNLTHLPSTSSTANSINQGRCGYALCPNPRRRFLNAGRFKMINKGRPDFDIVETAELERWCSTACTRRALWVKVQLSETAAWERAGGDVVKIELYPEKDEEAGGSEKSKTVSAKKAEPEGENLAATMTSLQLGKEDRGEGVAAEREGLRIEGEQRKAAQDKAALAVERGDEAGDVATRSVEVAVRERKVITPAQPPSLGDEPAEGGSIEGYKPKFGDEKKSHGEEESDEDWV